MNGFYILAYDHEKLKLTLNTVDDALNDLELNHQSKTTDNYIFSYCNISSKAIDFMQIVMVPVCCFEGFCFIFFNDMMKHIKYSMK
jgi:hypothetical protein